MRRRKIMMITAMAAALLLLACGIVYTVRQPEIQKKTQDSHVQLTESFTEPSEALKAEIFTEAPTEPETDAETASKHLKFQERYSMDWDIDEAYLMAKVAMAEAEGESTEGKAMVIMVILNRVFSLYFPGTIEEVIYQKKQFSPVWEDDWPQVEPSEDCWEAMRMIEAGWDESDGALYFESTYNGENTWHSRNLEYIKTVGNHNFYK